MNYAQLHSHIARVIRDPRTPADWAHVDFLTRAYKSALLNARAFVGYERATGRRP